MQVMHDELESPKPKIISQGRIRLVKFVDNQSRLGLRRFFGTNLEICSEKAKYDD